MSLLSKLKHGTTLVSDNPKLMTWFFRNKLRIATLDFERLQMEGMSRFARGVTFRLTNTCNLRCKMCRFVESGDVMASLDDCLPTEKWIEIIDDLATYRPYITLTGGEPFIHPGAGEIIKYIKQRNMRCTVTTNGTLLAKCAPDFIDNPPDVLIVSLDGPAEVHNEVRGQARVFERAVEGIQALKKLKEQHGQKLPMVVINCSITPYNYLHVDKMIDIAEQLGVDALNYQHQWSITNKMVDQHNELYGNIHRISCDELGGADPPSVDLDEMVNIVNRVKQQARDKRMIVTMHPELSGDQIRDWYDDPHKWVHRRPATCAWINTEVSPTGDVEPCYGVTCGNVTETKLSKIWNSAQYRDFRKRLAMAGDFPICVRCCAYFRRD